MAKKTTVLCILDGFGIGGASEENFLSHVSMPHWQALWETSPHTLIEASEENVGLPHGQMGNSEVGHMTLGAGRVILQDLPRVSHAFETGEIASHPLLTTCLETLKGAGRAVHVMGLLSPGGVHAHMDHIKEMVRLLAHGGVRVWVHAFLDGRDTPPQSASGYLSDFMTFLGGVPGAHLATLSGRYYAMDRDQRWERTHLAYDTLVMGENGSAVSPQEALTASYAKGVYDEFVVPHAFGEYPGILDGDAVVMVNFRADRVRQILGALCFEENPGFERARRPALSACIGMTPYSAALAAVMDTLLPNDNITQTLGEIVSQSGLTQLRLAETEKYAHVTYFFSGGREDPFPGEDRVLIPSPKVATYDLQPEMSAPEVTDRLCAAIASHAYDLIVVNYANTDMVGHTGDKSAAAKALLAIDACLGRIVETVREEGAVLVLTSDHGNIEDMGSEKTGPHTAHTLNPVPFVVMGAGDIRLTRGGLSDVAPTLLSLMGIAAPKEMTGRTLVEGAQASLLIRENTNV